MVTNKHVNRITSFVLGTTAAFLCVTGLSPVTALAQDDNYTTPPPECATSNVEIIWDDCDNQDGIRPDSLNVFLAVDGESVDIAALSEENGWYVEKKDLPTRINGEDVTWSWKEQGVAGYNPGVYNQDGTVTVITNTVTQLAKPDDDQKQPKRGGDTWVVFEEYDTALGGETIINHVGDCFD
jgi:hypothetical protein